MTSTTITPTHVAGLVPVLLVDVVIGMVFVHNGFGQVAKVINLAPRLHHLDLFLSILQQLVIAVATASMAARGPQQAALAS